MDQLPVVCPHTLGVQDLVPAADLESRGEILGILFKAPVSDHLLAHLVVGRHGEAGKDRANVPDLTRNKW